MLQNPGTEQLINMLGVQARAQGHMRETAEVFENLMDCLGQDAEVSWLSNMPPDVGHQCRHARYMWET